MGHDVRATWMRGGTSKCWLFARERLPGDPADRDRLISRVFGSPDARQIDGVGGATSTTSKVMVVDEARSGSGRVEYEFGQVVVEEPRVEWTSKVPLENSARVMARPDVTWGCAGVHGRRRGLGGILPVAAAAPR